MERARRPVQQSVRARSQSLRVELRIGAPPSRRICAPSSLGSETDGSIVCPSSLCGVVGIKPTVGLTSRAGVVPISHTQDTVGPHARTVADAAAVLTVIASQTFDGRDAATGGVPLGLRGIASRPTLPTNYMQFVDHDGLRGARIGVTRQGIDDIDAEVGGVVRQRPGCDDRRRARILVDLDEAGFVFPPPDGEFLVLLYDFKIDVKNYFATRVGVPMAGKTLADAIAFNEANAAREMPYFAQEIFELAELIDVSSPDAPQPVFGGMTYNQALDIDQAAGATNGIDAALSQFNISAIATPTGTPAWTTDVINGDHFEFATSGIAAVVGYPIINVPMGNVFGLPVGISFIGTAFSEPTLIKLSSGFEHVVHARRVPQFFADAAARQRQRRSAQPPASGTRAGGGVGTITACKGVECRSDHLCSRTAVAPPRFPLADWSLRRRHARPQLFEPVRYQSGSAEPWAWR